MHKIVLGDIKTATISNRFVQFGPDTMEVITLSLNDGTEVSLLPSRERIELKIDLKEQERKAVNE